MFPKGGSLIHFDFYVKLFYLQILFDFEIRSPGVDPNALIEKWETLKHRIVLDLTLEEKNECANYFDTEIGFFIALLKQLSTKPKFEEKVDSFIIFTDVSVSFFSCY